MINEIINQTITLNVDYSKNIIVIEIIKLILNFLIIIIASCFAYNHKNIHLNMNLCNDYCDVSYDKEVSRNNNKISNFSDIVNRKDNIV